MIFKDFVIKHKKKIISFAVFFILLFITIYYICSQIRPSEIKDAFMRADKGFMLCGVIMVFIFLFMQGLCYKICFSAMGIKSSIIDSFKYSCADFYGAAVTPSATGGQPLCAYFMAKDGIPVYKSGPVLLLQTIVFKSILIILSIWAFLIRMDFALHATRLGKWLFMLGIIINLLIVVICLLAMFSKKIIGSIGYGVISLLAKIHIFHDPKEKKEQYTKWIGDYHESAEYIRKNVKAVVFTVAFTFIQRIAMFAIPYFVYRGMGVEVTNGKIFDFIALQIILAMSVDSMPSPGAMGIAEMLFKRFFGAVYPMALIMPAMVLTRGISYYFCLIFTAIIVLISYIRIQRKSNRIDKED